MTQECGDFVPLSPRLDPGNRDVGTERPGLATEAQLVKKLLSLLKDEFNLTPALANSYPDDIHPLQVRKRSSALDLEGEWWKGHLRKSRLYFLNFRGADIPEKFQSQMDVPSFHRFQISSQRGERRHNGFDLRENFFILKIDRNETANLAA